RRRHRVVERLVLALAAIPRRVAPGDRRQGEVAPVEEGEVAERKPGRQLERLAQGGHAASLMCPCEKRGPIRASACSAACAHSKTSSDAMPTSSSAAFASPIAPRADAAAARTSGNLS